MTDTTIMYKIRMADGTFSKGGSWPSFSKTGKVWKRKGDISSHMTQLSGQGRKLYRDRGAEVIELITTVSSATPIDSYLDDVITRAEQRAVDDAARIKKYREEAERAQYLALHKKFGGEKS